MSSVRVHWVDWLKVLGVLAIVFYHIALVFSLTPWMISNPQHSVVLSGIVGWGYLWGLQLLFVLAGASSFYARRHRSAGKFARERLLRLGVPLLIGLVLLSPLQAYFAYLGGGGHLEFGAFLARYLPHVKFYFDPVWLIRTGYHLWFLGFLLVISIFAIPVQSAMDRLPARLQARFPAHTTWPAAAAFLPVIPIAAFQVALRPFFSPDMSWPDLGSDLVYYVAGYTLAGSPGFAAAVRRLPRASLVAAVVGWSGVGFMFLFRVMPGWSEPYESNLTLAAFALLHALGTWGWILFLIGVAMHWFDRPHPLITYGNEAILPLYVLHHPVVVVLAFYIVQLQAAVWPKFALLFTSVILVTVGFYHFVIRRFGPLRFVFGLSYSPKTADEQLFVHDGTLGAETGTAALEPGRPAGAGAAMPRRL